MVSSSLVRTTVDFLRHGETVGGNYFRGITDDPLSDHGLQQMLQQCHGEQWEVVISSPLKRCYAFASAWGPEHGANVVIVPDWREIDFGDWEEKTAEQICSQNPEALTKFYADPTQFTPPNAESYICFSDRIQRAWENLLVNFSGRNVLVVTHAGVIRSLFSTLLAVPLRQSFQIDVPHACLTRFSCFDDAAGRFVQLNFHKPI